MLSTWFLAQKLRFTSFVEELKSERVDTNFISIMILLAIALALATFFITTKDRILDWVNPMIEGFFN